MAAIRSFKKDISYVTSEIVVECFTYNFLFPDKNQDELAGIIADSVNMKLELINNINTLRRTKKAPLGNEIKKVRIDFKDRVESLAERLSKLSLEESK